MISQRQEIIFLFRPSVTLLQRFAENISAHHAQDECHIWTAGKRFNIKGKSYTPQRVAWMLYNKCLLSNKIFVQVTCGNADCVNPRHLRAVLGGNPSQSKYRRDYEQLAFACNAAQDAANESNATVAIIKCIDHHERRIGYKAQPMTHTRSPDYIASVCPYDFDEQNADRHTGLDKNNFVVIQPHSYDPYAKLHHNTTE
jgi:hypothetical protein